MLCVLRVLPGIDEVACGAASSVLLLLFTSMTLPAATEGVHELDYGNLRGRRGAREGNACKFALSLAD